MEPEGQQGELSRHVIGPQLPTPQEEMELARLPYSNYYFTMLAIGRKVFLLPWQQPMRDDTTEPMKNNYSSSSKIIILKDFCCL